MDQHGTVGNSHFLGLLEETFQKNPRGVFDSLFEIGATPEVIQSVISQFASTALKETINEFLGEE